MAKSLVTTKKRSRTDSGPSKPTRPLEGQVAIVAGATRGAGRGIARALGEAGATVYCTGRSVRGNLSPYGRPETIDETAELINQAGGTAVAVRVDHTVESEVEALFARVKREQHRLDIVADCVAGEDPLLAQWASFWKVKLDNADAGLRQALVSHIITAKHAALTMMPSKRGLIVEVTEGDQFGAGGNPMTQVVKLALKENPPPVPEFLERTSVEPPQGRVSRLPERQDIDPRISGINEQLIIEISAR